MVGTREYGEFAEGVFLTRIIQTGHGTGRARDPVVCRVCVCVFVGNVNEMIKPKRAVPA